MFIAAALAAALGTIPAGGVKPDEMASYQAQRDQAMRDADAQWGGSPCPAATLTPVALIPWKIGNDPNALVWVEQDRVQGCGRDTLITLHIGRFPGGDTPWKMVPTLPGDSIADMTLQQSALPQAIQAASVGLPEGCKGGQIRNIYVSARPGHVLFGGPDGKPPPARKGYPGVTLPAQMEGLRGNMKLDEAWAEVWPITLCGQDRTLMVVFIPLRDQRASYFLFLPVWQMVQADGPGALPAPATE